MTKRTKKKSGSWERPPEGEIRRSQLITTYGPGSMVDLVDDAVVIWGLDAWRFMKRYDHIEEQRLRERLAPRLKSEHGIQLAQSGYFRAPPDGDSQTPTWGRAIKATVFPKWMVCQDCRRLLRLDNLDRRKDRYVHDCKKSKPMCVPVRFVAACPAGHLEEFPWEWFVHRGPRDKERCPAPVMYLDEGRSGDFSGVQITCVCGVGRRLVDAKLESKTLPRCGGRRPWLDRKMGKESCEHRLKLMVRTASNSYFSVTESALSIPEEGSRLHDVVNDHWKILGKADAAAMGFIRTLDDVGPALAEWPSDDQVLEVIAQVKAGQKPPRDEIRRAEFKRLAAAPLLRHGDLPAPERADFYARRVPEARFEPALPAGIAGVTLAYKLREVRVQLGFTRFSPTPRNLKGETERSLGEVTMARLGLETDWLPAVEILGEGIFLQLDEEAVQAWEKRPAVREWEAELRAGFDAWARTHQTSAVFPGARFFMLHSLSHLLITQLSLECGYAASAIRERIYCDGASAATPMAAILLKTGTPGTEGTLGGLVEQGERIGYHLEQAVRLGELCSNDPVCAQHSPKGDLAERYHDGAACYACMFVAESSCEWFNRHLDRSLVVPVVGRPAERAFFGHEAFGQARPALVVAKVAEEPPKGQLVEPEAPSGTMEGPWGEVLEACVLPGKEELIARLRDEGVPIPMVGDEVAEGVPVALAWSGPKVAVTGPDAKEWDLEDLENAGWRVIRSPVDVDELLEALEGGG